MSLVPTGKTRVMVAQNFTSPLSEGYEGKSVIDEGSGPMGMETGDAMEEDINENTVDNGVINDDVSIQPGEEEQIAPKENGRKTLTTYVYEKLQSYGYPGRRLQDFKAEFVKESISPDGVKDIQVVIPDKKYPDEKGFTDTIENEELKEISLEINKSFGLNFNGAERSDGKWTIKFTSADLASPDDEVSRDSLDQVYGKPDKSKTDAQKPMKSASTLKEMMKTQKDKVITKLKKIIGE
jgi:hypothetical protein